MEIESKFLILNESETHDLETLSQLGNYSLSETVVQLIEDTFLDTEKIDLMAEGYYLRLRKETGKEGQWLTIKSLEGFGTEVHKREEYTSFLPNDASVFDCSDIMIKKKIFELSSGFNLSPLLRLKQKRIVRQVKLGDRDIAEFSLEQVNIKYENREKFYSHLEVELKKEGTVQDLQAILEYLMKNYNLTEDHFSKFERALLFKDNIPEKTLLNFRERAFCMQLSNQENVYGKYARILLSLDKGLGKAELSLLLRIPESEIENVYSNFEKNRLSIFPFYSTIDGSEKFHFQTWNLISDKNLEKSVIKEWSLETLFELYEVDRVRAENVKDCVLTLFDGLYPYHRLGEDERKILGFAALLQNIGSSVSPKEKSRMGKEILLTHPLKGLKFHELRMLALIMDLQATELSGKNLSSFFEKSNIVLSPEFKNKALILASFIRIFDLFEKVDLKFLLGRIRQVEGAIEVELKGKDAEKAVKRAEERSELWEFLFEMELLFIHCKEIDEDSPITIKTELEKKNGKKSESKKEKGDLRFVISPESSMPMVAQKVFSQQLARMLTHEKGARKGENIEDLHDMRVAIRRMRAAENVFGAYLDSRKLEPHLKGLRNTLGALGATRDLDVFQEKAQEYLKKLPPENKHDLEPLFAVLAEEREKARKNMLAYLDDEKYASFKKDFSDLLSVPESWTIAVTTRKHDALPHRIKDTLPSILYARFADISAYSEWVEGPHISIERLHRLRIATKGLRYTLEFFGELLGKEAETMINEFKALQDHLGDLHDAVVAIDLMETYIQSGKWDSSEGRKGSEEDERDDPEGLRGVKAYKAWREQELLKLLDTFPEAWAKIQSKEFRQEIEKAIRNLY